MTVFTTSLADLQNIVGLLTGRKYHILNPDGSVYAAGFVETATAILYIYMNYDGSILASDPFLATSVKVGSIA